jgi:phage gpG-like protein
VIAIQIADDAAAQQRLRKLGEAAESGIARAVTKLGIELRNTVQQDKLSGQVLHPRTGTLRDSITTQIEQRQAVFSATVSSEARYAAVQEYGFQGRVDVRASLRRITKAFGRPIAPITIGVGAHSRRMDLPPHSFLRSSLDDMAPYIGSEIEDALREALQ